MSQLTPHQIIVEGRALSIFELDSILRANGYTLVKTESWLKRNSKKFKKITFAKAS